MFHSLMSYGPVAQWITRLTTDQKIPGSTPGRLEIFFRNSDRRLPSYYWPTQWSSVILLASVCRLISSVVVVCNVAGVRAGRPPGVWTISAPEVGRPTLDGGSVQLRPVTATPCLLYFVQISWISSLAYYPSKYVDSYLSRSSAEWPTICSVL